MADVIIEDNLGDVIRVDGVCYELVGPTSDANTHTLDQVEGVFDHCDACKNESSSSSSDSSSSQSGGGYDYLVEGAGRTYANGEYNQNGTYGGFAAYENSNGYWIYYEGFVIINSSLGGVPGLYLNGGWPPETGSWSVTGGAAPAPTVTAG